MLEQFLKMIGYEKEISGDLELTKLELDSSSDELLSIFHAASPLDVEEMKDLVLHIERAKIKGVSKINYDFTFDKYSDSSVIDYYKFTIEKLSESSTHLVASKDYEKSYSASMNTLTIKVPSSDNSFFLSRVSIITYLRKIGFKTISIYLEMFNRDSEIAEQLKRAKKEMIDEISSSQVNKSQSVYLKESKELFGTPIELKDFAEDQEGYEEFVANQKGSNFVVSGKIVFIDSDSLSSPRKNAKFILFDGTDYIYCMKRINDKAEENYFQKLETGMNASVQCYPRFNNFGSYGYMNITNMKHSSSIAPITLRVDNEEEKRVELHLHTKMSALDGVPEMSQYFEAAKIFGHKALAVSDHGSVQSYHDLYSLTKKDASIKPLYGLELLFVDEEEVVPAYEPKDIALDDATYVVFDLETTGISVNYERIIEVSAVKIKQNQIIGRFSELVNPEKNIHYSVVELTGITKKDVEKARNREEVLKDFLDFIKGSILVAHNASFDIGHLYKNFKDLDIYFEKFPVIDTLILGKILYPNHKRYTLDALAKLLNVELKQHHRALDDATATEEIFLHMLLELKKRGIKYHSEINTIVDKKEAFKYPYPVHINLLAKNHQGLINLYHILSIASTEYFADEPLVTKAVLEKYREGILVGSGCRNSYFFDIAFNESDEKMEQVIGFYDYIELQPLNSFIYYSYHMDDYVYCVTDTMKRIIKMADKYNIPVCATGDCHQVNKEDLIYRKILVDTPQVGKARFHYLKREKEIPAEYFMTTKEMLEEFAFLGDKRAYEIVVMNTNMIADACDYVESFSDEAFPPQDDFLKEKGIESAEQYVIDTVYNKAYSLYGELLPGMVLDRIKHEMSAIVENKFSTIYLISYLLVKKSRDDGYVVGSRGSVGSSFVAHLMDITEVNSLPPHYRCPKCHYSAFKMTEEEKRKYGLRPDEEKFQNILANVESGFDLPDEVCPICGTALEKDGHDIPFETFLGVPENPKTPDIDLNFSGENQSDIHEYIRELFGEYKAFRAGTILTCQSKTAYSIVRDYFDDCDKDNIAEGISPVYHRKAEIEALSLQITGVKKTSSQHPGGIVVVPENHEIYEVTPVQYPGDSVDRSWMITHFDYHSFEKNLFKLDVLGHDDPTVIRYLMKFVEAHPEKFPFKDAFHIPVNDPKVYKMMNGTEVIGVTPSDIKSSVATYGISEFGTNFVRGLLDEARPKSFGELVKVSGLSHGTDTWRGNTEDLLNGEAKGFPKIPFKDVIGCRDDIMIDLISDGVPADLAFQTMEFVRKGKPSKDEDKWALIVDNLKQYKVPEWYLWSCSKIKYMFPKAHATAYVIMALRIAWFKLYRPIYFYSAILSKKMNAFDISVMTGGVSSIRIELDRLNAIPQNERKAKDEDLITTLEISLEMCVRGFKFYGVDLYKSSAADFRVADDESGLYMPFIAVDSLGENCALSIINAREEKPFSTQSDFMRRTSTSKTVMEKMKDLGCFDEIPEDNQLSLDLGL
ncbi:MAG: PolC-type DNA polymerase III [Bacillales bacterium]|nr:PolC-type DNA polymerase III [Bacillales bacterium]